MKRTLIALSILIIAQTVQAQSAQKTSAPPALNVIKVADLKKDLYALADAHYRGRSAGTIDELKASMWLGELYRTIGLLPAGDDGTYFQYFNMWHNHISDNSNISINNQTLALWKEVTVAQMANVQIDAPILYLGNAATMNITNLDVKGKVLAIEANAAGINQNVSLPTWRYPRNILAKYGNALIAKGAAAIIFINDDVAENAWTDANENNYRGTFDIDGGPNAVVQTKVPVLWVHAASKQLLQSAGATLKANLIIEHQSYPSVNIVGLIKGTDKNLASEYLLYSGHQDAHGVRNSNNTDSVYYGADDNASVDVAMMANARAFIKNPSKRSVLFVIHGAEERGLLGSRYYSSHPTVPLQSIVAVLNGDMIGRNNPDSAALLGVQAPHRNSSELVAMALSANEEGPKFKLDTLWDKPAHVEGWFFRSDHLPYARLGIPSIMYTTLLHPDYHTPLDDAQHIDYDKLKKMADWMYRTGWKVANAAVRPAKDANFKLER
ncbi:MAG: M28 family peptidase [Bacteroidota bacterium]